MNFVNQRFKHQKESWGIGVMGVLDLELLWHFTSSFGSKDLLAANPTIFVHKVEPTSNDFEPVPLSATYTPCLLEYLRKIHVPICNG